MKMLSRYRALPFIEILVFCSLQPIGPVRGCGLAVLVGVHDLGRGERMDGLVLGRLQNSASSVFEMRQASTLRVNRSKLATR